MTEPVDDAARGRSEPLVGAPIERREDGPLLRGTAEYVGDITPANGVHMAILRSRHAHASIGAIRTGPAERLDGVIAVFTALDLERAALPTPGRIPIKRPAGVSIPEYTHRAVLAADRVRHHGEALAAVVAEDPRTARDGLDRLEVDYDRLDSVTDVEAALDDETPLVHADHGSNRAFEWEQGEADELAATFEAADHVVELTFGSQRLVPNPIEPRGVVAEYDRSSDRVTVHMSTQTPHYHRQRFAEILQVPENRFRVVAPSVGGGFGSKSRPYPGEVLAVWCSLHLGRSVKWIPTRTESYLSDTHGRGLRTTAELALDADGVIQGLQVDNIADMGAYVSNARALLTTNFHAGLLSNQYAIDDIACRTVGVFTHTTPLDAYRGVSEVRAIQIVERLVRKAATELDLDPVELRRRNLIPADAFPYKSATGLVYDSGDYETALEAGLAAVEYEELRAEQRSLRADGRYLGIGLCPFVEISGFGPSKQLKSAGWEFGRVRLHRSGSVTVYSGTADHGQGHATVYAQIVADELGVPYDDIEVVEGDTARVPQGTGTFASRSVTVAGGAITRSVEKLLDRAREVAAERLEADEADLEFADGAFSVAGAPHRSITLQEIAEIAHATYDLSDGAEPRLEASAFYDPTNFTFPFGVHAAVVEVDPDTGAVDVRRYVVIEDCGRQINPSIVEGQVHGGTAQGIGQALFEAATYDDNGTLLTGSHSDYAMPRADMLPEFEVDHTVTPSPHNPLGVKGMGESGTIAAPTAVANAVIDALEPFGVADLELPMTPERVWRAINDR